MIFDAGLTNPKAFINYNRNNHFRVFVKLLKFYTLLFLVILTPNHIFSQTYRPDTLNGQTVRTCSGTFYDSGADTGNYSNNENWIVTFCADSGRIKIDFLSLDLRNEGGDTLKIYDGENTSAPLLGTYTGEGLSFTVQSTDSCLTFQFTTDGSLVNSGWTAGISCCPVPLTSAITGSTEECIFTAGTAYSVVITPSSSYNWIITGGTQSGGGSTNSIAVDWGSVPGAAKVKVVEDNGCSTGDTVSLDVTLHSLPVISFFGLGSEYDLNLDGPVTLTGSPPGGIFSGNGIAGDIFTPSSAGVGTHEIIYDFTDANSCSNTDTQYVDVLNYDFMLQARLIDDINNYCSADAAYSNSAATGDQSAGSCWSGGTDHNVWFKFVAPGNAVEVQVITGGASGSMRGQQIALWNEAGTEVKCINAANWFAGTLSLSIDTLTAGNTYYISVDDRTQHGTFALCLNDEATYDYLSGALSLSSIDNWCSADQAYENTYATLDESPGSCWSGGNDNNVWFSFTATTSSAKISVLTGSTYGSMRGQQIALWNSEGTEVKCVVSANWFAGTLDMSIDTLTIGHEYFISVDDRTQHGTFSLCVDDAVDYDYKSGAEFLYITDNWCSSDEQYDNTYATGDESPGSCWTGGTDHNVWFRFLAETGTIKVDILTGGTYGTMRGQQVVILNEAGEEIACNQSANWYAGTLSVQIDTLTAGQIYYISVDDRTQHGTFSICINDRVGYDFRQGAELLLDVDYWCSTDAAYDNTYATGDETAGSCWTGGTDHNVWFKFVAISGQIQIDVRTGGTYGTMRGQQIALWNTGGSEVGCIESANWFAGTLSLSSDTLTAGRIYYISVDDRTQHGSFVLCVNNRVGYDFKQGATTLPSFDNWCSNDAVYDNTYATQDESPGSCWTGGTDHNVWFKFDAPAENVTVSILTGGSYGTMRGQQIAVWNESGQEVACINSANWFAGTLELSVDTLTTGHLYYISVDDRTQHGSFSLCINFSPSYDYKSGAVNISNISEWCSSDAQYDNTYATGDESAGSCWTGGTDHNVWFYFTATTTSVTLEVTTGGSYGTMRGQQIALWNESGDEVACINSANWFAGVLALSSDTLTPGHTYYISVDDRTQHGSFSLCIDDEENYDFKTGAYLVVDVDNWCSSDAAFDNTYATQDESPGSCWAGSGTHNVWFKFVALSGEVEISVTTGGSSGTMRGQEIALWNTSGAEIHCISSANWYAGTLSLSMDTLTAGRTYWISVDDRTQHGSFSLCVNNKVGFDFKTGSLLLSDLDNWCSADAAYNNTYATADETAGSCWTGGTDHNVWFTFFALFDSVTVTVNTGGTYGTMRGQQLAIWNSDGTETGCANAANWYAGSLSLSVDTLTAGHQYWISVDDRTQHGTFSLCINNVSGVEYWSIADGNWNDNLSWSKTEGGPAGTDFPTIANIVHIKGYQITVTGNESCATLDMEVVNNNTVLDINGGNLEINGTAEYYNNGSDYSGDILIRNGGGLLVEEDLEAIRNGGNASAGIDITGNSTLNVDGNLIFTSSAGSSADNELNLSGTAEMTVAGDLTLTNSGGPKIMMTLDNSAVFNAGRNISFTASSDNLVEIEMNNNSTLNLSGNFVRGAPAYGRFTGNDDATLVFKGTSYLQTWPENSGAGTDEFTYQNVTINNTKITAPQVTLEGPVEVNGTLTLTDGLVRTTAANLLVIVNGATVTGSSDNSYIDGPVKKTGNTSFEFPVGNGGNYQPVGISAPAAITDEFTAQYFYSNPHPTYNNTLREVTLNNISECEYWILTRDAGSSNVNVTASFDTNSCCISDLDTMRIAVWEGTQWIDHGNGGTTGTVSSGTITSGSALTENTNVISFANTLPVVSFSGLAASYCGSDASVLLTGNPAGAAGVFSGQGITDLGDGTATFDPGTVSAGIHAITYIYNDPVSGCSNDDVQYVTVYGLPRSSMSGSDTICPDAQTTLTIYFTGKSPWDFEYTNGTDTVSASTSQNPYAFQVSDTGVYRVISLIDANGCSGTDFGASAIVSYYPSLAKPVISASGPVTFCEGDNVDLSVAPAGNFALWSTGETTWSITATEPGSYNVRIVDNHNCVSPVSDDTIVTVNKVPRKPFNITGNTSICQNGPNSDLSSYSVYATSYNWYILPDTAGIFSGNTASVALEWDSLFTGVATLTVKGENVDCGEGPASNPLLITVNALPDDPGTIYGDTSLCRGDNGILYSIYPVNNTTSYAWSVPSGAVISGATDDTIISVNYGLAATDGNITVTALNGCGNSMNSSTLPVKVHALPSPALSGSVTGFIDDTIQYTTESGMINYDWTVSAGGQVVSGGGLSDTTVFIRWTASGAQWAGVNYENTDSCSALAPTILNVTISDVPGKPGIPSGSDTLCQNNPDSDYLTSGATGATSYTWVIDPSEAGTFSGTGTTGTVNWEDTWYGIATITVYGENASGQGPASDPYTVVVIKQADTGSIYHLPGE